MNLLAFVGKTADNSVRVCASVFINVHRSGWNRRFEFMAFNYNRTPMFTNHFINKIRIKIGYFFVTNYFCNRFVPLQFEEACACYKNVCVDIQLEY